MENLRRAILKTALITPSGALSPGPLSAAAIAAGTTMGVMGGLLVAIGHLIAEAPYYIVLILVMGMIEYRLKKVKPLLDLVAGGFMLLFAYLLILTGVNLFEGGGLNTTVIISHPATAVITGAILTGANAYFLAWWFTVGKPIIDSAKRLGGLEASIIYGVHYSYDLVWLIILAGIGGLAGYGGKLVLSTIMFALAIILGYYGVKMILNLAGQSS